MGWDIAAGKVLLDPLQELDVDRHKILKAAMDRTVFNHPDLSLALDDLCFDLAYLLVQQLCPILRAAHDLFTSFLDAFRTQRIRLTRPAKGRLGLLPGFQQRLFRPFRRKRRIDFRTVKEMECIEGDACAIANRSVDVLHQTFAGLHFDVLIAVSVVIRSVGLWKLDRGLQRTGQSASLTKSNGKK